MTRFNVGIPPIELSDKHLLAEHREIKRIPNNVKSGKAKLENIPEHFTLGTGHVKFFYNKLKYLHIRYNLILAEALRRGFNVTDYNSAWDGVPDELYNDYSETVRDRALILQRLKENNARKG